MLFAGRAEGAVNGYGSMIGASRQVVPTAPGRMLQDAHPKTSNRVADAPMPVTEPEIAALQRADDQRWRVWHWRDSTRIDAVTIRL